MCTAITYRTRDHYFGRNLDLSYSYNEQVTVLPRRYPLVFRKAEPMQEHFAMIGMATVVDGVPLFYDATNEKGLSMAGLNFPGNAHYFSVRDDRDNIAPFELIPWILGQCENLIQARKLLERMNIADICFSETVPNTPLHWMISDPEGSIVVESVKDGLKVYENPAEVLTNNPTFDMHLMNLNNYMHLSSKQAENRFSDRLEFNRYSFGLGAIGLPGDLSSMSRFVRAAFTRLNSCSGDSESESISQFFHILAAVAYVRGCVELGKDEYQTTMYSSCCNSEKGVYYYTTYGNSRITAVDMHRENLDGDAFVSYPLVCGQDILLQNQ